MDVHAVLSKAQQLKIDRDLTLRRSESLESEVALIELDLDTTNQASALLHRLSEEEVENGIKTYVLLLEEGLKAIFPEQEVGLVAEIDKIRGKISLRLKTTFKGQDGISVEGEGLDSFGGAVTTVQSLLLRISLILKRGLKPFMILDESFPAVDGERTDLLVDFLKALCARLDMDILVVTHNPSISDRADISYVMSPSVNGAKITRAK